MAASGSSVWPSLAAGQRARATEVETKFDWLEANIMPMLSGSTTDLAYDLGGTITAHWRSLYTGSLNPTSTARGIAVGTTTVANNSDVAFEIAGSRSLLFPRITSAQRTALTGVNGMVAYDSTLNQFYAYQNGGWIGMAGSPIGAITKVRTTGNGSTTTVVDITVAGRLVSAFFQLPGAGATPGAFQAILDSVATDFTFGSTGTSAAVYLQQEYGNTTGSFAQTSASVKCDAFFKQQLQVYTWGTQTVTAAILYESA